MALVAATYTVCFFWLVWLTAAPVNRQDRRRRRAEESLRQSEETFALAFTSNAAAISLTRFEDGVFLDANDTYVALTGFSRQEAIGQSARKMHIWPTAEAAARYVQELREKGSVRGWEQEFVKKSGETFVAQLWAQTLVVRGEKVILATVIDITDRKRAEEALHEIKDQLEVRVQERTAELAQIAAALRVTSLYARSLIEASLDPLVTISPDGKITDVNKATEEATGVPRATLIGRDFSDYFTEPEKARAGYKKVLAEGFVRDYPLTIRHVSGRTMDVLYNATVYRNEAGQVQGVFAAARDITDRRRHGGATAGGLPVRPQPDRGQPRPAGHHQPRREDHRR